MYVRDFSVSSLRTIVSTSYVSVTLVLVFPGRRVTRFLVGSIMVTVSGNSLGDL